MNTSTPYEEEEDIYRLFIVRGLLVLSTCEDFSQKVFVYSLPFSRLKKDQKLLPIR